MCFCGCLCLGAQLCHTQELFRVCLALHAPGRVSDLITEKERSFLDAGCHLFIQPIFSKNLVCAKPCAGHQG